MICIECLSEVPSLFTLYTNNHIQLTECGACHSIADKYIEIDNVLLFIDLLLLKPGAYRHLVYNSLEVTMLESPKTVETAQGDLTDQVKLMISNVKRWLVRFDSINRYWVLLTAFEVYLIWYSEEQKTIMYNQKFKREGLLPSNSISGIILKTDPLYQYLYFASYCILDIVLLHYLILFFTINLAGWGYGVKFPRQTLSYTILLSYGAKIFPILMLIWPYDTVFSMSIIKWVANLYLIESLRIVTKKNYRSIIMIFAIVSLLKLVFTKLLMGFLVTNSSANLLLTYKTELQLMFQKYFIAQDFI